MRFRQHQFRPARVLCSAALALPLVAQALTANVLVTGDSITRRTGLCGPTDTYASCNAAGKIAHEQSYASLIPPASSYDYQVVYSSGRGGDTCTTQAKYSDGPFVGLDRGLLARLQSTVVQPATSQGASLVSVLIGINDVNVYNVPEASVIDCIKAVWTQLRSAGFKVRAMTYPQISAQNTVFANPAISQTRALSLNRAIRAAVAQFNGSVAGVNPVKLVDAELAYGAAEVSSLSVDGVHPNAQGAHRIARQWVQTP